MEQTPEAVTRTETFVSAILDRLNGGEGNPGITPVTRTEIFLDAILNAIPDMTTAIARQVLQTINAKISEAMNKDSFIRNFSQTLAEYNLSLADYGKIRAAIYYHWSDNPDLTAEEITEIFGEADPAELDTAALETAVLAYAHLTYQDWQTIVAADAQYHITSTYLPSRAAIQEWVAAHSTEG